MVGILSSTSGVPQLGILSGGRVELTTFDQTRYTNKVGRSGNEVVPEMGS